MKRSVTARLAAVLAARLPTGGIALAAKVAASRLVGPNYSTAHPIGHLAMAIDNGNAATGGASAA